MFYVQACVKKIMFFQPGQYNYLAMKKARKGLT